MSFLNCRNTLNVFSWAIDYFQGNIGFWTCFIKDDSQLLTAEALVDFSNKYTNGKGDKQDSFSGDADLEDNVTCSPAEERVERKLRLGRRPSRSAARQLLEVRHHWGQILQWEASPTVIEGLLWFYVQCTAIKGQKCVINISFSAPFWRVLTLSISVALVSLCRHDWNKFFQISFLQLKYSWGEDLFW